MIEKKLKNYCFKYHEDKHYLELVYLSDDEPAFILDKIRMFSLFRFLIRVSQRLSSKRRKHENL